MNKKLSVLLVIIILFVFGLSTFAVAQEVIKIGGLFALTGALSPYGPPIADAAKLAFKDINEAGGVLGKNLEFVVRDTGTAAAMGRDAASKLVEIDKVPAIIGALSSGVTVAASSIAIDGEVVLISPASTSPMVTNLEDNDYVFRTCVSDALQGVVQARLAVNLGYQIVSVIYVNNPYGKGLADVFKENFEAVGGEVLAMVPYEEAKPSYRGEVEAALDASPDAINLIGYPVDGNKMLIEAIELGYEGEYIFPDGMKGEGVSPGPACDPEAPLDQQYIEGSFGTAPGALSVAVAEAFDAAYTEEYGPSGIPFRSQSYDAAILIALAIQKTGPEFLGMSRVEQGQAIRDNLRAVANPHGEVVTYGELTRALTLLSTGVDINYQGVSGPLTFDKNGDMAEGAIELWTVKGCNVQTVWIVEVEN